MVALDLQCITWILRTPFDKAIHLLALRFLTTMTTLANFKPTLVLACFGIVAGCMAVVGSKAVIARGSEELVAMPAFHCLRILFYPRSDLEHPQGHAPVVHQRISRVSCHTTLSVSSTTCFTRCVPIGSGFNTRISGGATSRSVKNTSSLQIPSPSLLSSNTTGGSPRRCHDGSSASPYILYPRYLRPSPTTCRSSRSTLDVLL